MDQFEAKESSSVGWARMREDGVLEIDFKKDGIKASTYAYDGTRINENERPVAGFPRDVWEQFKISESKGRFFAYVIRPKFKGVKQ